MAIRDEDVLPVCNFCEASYDPYDRHTCAGNNIEARSCPDCAGRTVACEKHFVTVTWPHQTIDGHPTACDPLPNGPNTMTAIDWFAGREDDPPSLGIRCQHTQVRMGICDDCGAGVSGLTRQQIGEALDEEREETIQEQAASMRRYDALRSQIGGDHYRQMKIQPVEFIIANGIGFLAGNVIKYAARYKAKGGAEDVRKIIHYCKLILEFEYGEKS